jgi:hypothetical protein
VKDPERVGKEDKHQTQAGYHSDHQNPLHCGVLIFQVHEIADDQGRLDDGQDHQNFQHAEWLKDLPVSQHNFNRGQDEQRSPNPEVLSLAFVMRCGDVVHREFFSYNAEECYTLVDIKYTNGKMNIQTRSTKCQ